MTIIAGNIQDIGYQPLSGTLTATSVDFRDAGGTLIAPESRSWPIVAGAVSVALLPGPARLTIQVGSHARDEWDVIVPDSDVELATLIADSIEWAPPVVSLVGEHRRAAEAAADRAEQAAEDVDAAIAGAADQVVQAVEGDRVAAESAATSAAEDRVQTGLDRTATAADRVQTGLDRVATGQDRTATGEDRTQTGLDREQTRLDRVATGQDRTQTGLDRVAAAESASAAETAANEFGLTVTSSQVGPEVPSSATLSGDGPAYAIHLDLSKGRPGDKGDPGEVTTAALNAALAGKADLTGGQVPTSQLPAIALTKPFPVADRAGMLALSAQEGDVAVITAGADKGTYMLGSGASGTFASWVKLTVPDAPVQSVNGQTGTVNLGASDVGAAPSSHSHTKGEVGLGNVDNTSDVNKPVSTAQQAAINVKTEVRLVASFPASPETGVLYVTGE